MAASPGATAVRSQVSDASRLRTAPTRPGSVARQLVPSRLVGRAPGERSTCRLARRAIRRAYDEELVIRTESESLEKLRVELARQRRRSDAVITAGVVFLGGILWLVFATRPSWIGWLLAGVGIVGLASRLRAVK